MKRCINLTGVLCLLLTMAACGAKPTPTTVETVSEPCADALIAYALRYPAAEPTDLYKLVFQDLYGPGHLLTDSAACAMYIDREVASMGDSTALPLYEYTLCDSHFVRINLNLVKDGTLGTGQLTSAVMRSAEGLPSPDPRFVMSHSQAFKAAYNPHYRIVRRDIFENEIAPKAGICETATTNLKP